MLFCKPKKEKKSDGAYHFGYWERHWFHPKNK
jgi:hypothetical protein